MLGAGRLTVTGMDRGASGRLKERASMIEGTVRDAAEAMRDERAGQTREMEARLLERLRADQGKTPAVTPCRERPGPA